MKQKKLNPFSNPVFMRRLKALRIMEDNGDITGLTLFREVKLTEAAVPWKCPFVYKTQGGVKVFEAFKTERCPVFKVIVRLWANYGPGRLLVTAYSGDILRINKIVEPFTKVNAGGNSDSIKCKETWPGNGRATRHVCCLKAGHHGNHECSDGYNWKPAEGGQ